MSRPEILERITTRPDRLPRSLAMRQAWQPTERDQEIVRRHDDEGQACRVAYEAALERRDAANRR